MMSREDILRELELLPMWHLRNATAAEKKTESLPSAQLIEQESHVQALASQPHQYRLITSDDDQWLFALDGQHNEEAETLLHNMLKAVAVKIGQDIKAVPVTTMADFKPKVIVAMGESVAQQLLTAQPLTQLRGAVHMLKEVPVIATYAPHDLLQHPINKAGAWEDLCLAKSTITHL
jgi:uracil-DNA glycosylase